MKSDRRHLLDLLNYLEAVKTFTAEGKDAFVTDRKTQYAVIRAYEVIGEIAKRLSDDLRDAHPEANWQQLINFRDFLAHNYERILLQNMWAAVEDLPQLQAAVEAVIRSLPDDETT